MVKLRGGYDDVALTANIALICQIILRSSSMMSFRYRDRMHSCCSTKLTLHLATYRKSVVAFNHKKNIET